MPNSPIKIMVASSVYGFEYAITSLCATLEGFGYEVLNSHFGTVSAGFHKSNLDSCLAAVEECDVFLGIIRPYYGSGIVGERSITHEEFRKAIAIDKPRMFLAHHNVTLARQILKPYLGFWKKNTNPDFAFEKTKAFEDLRILEMYDEATNSTVPIEQRKDHWVQEFSNNADILRFVDANFKDINRVRKELQQL